MFLSWRLIGRSGEPTPLSPLKSLRLVISRNLRSITTSSQNRITCTRLPDCSRNSTNRAICVDFPAPSIPEKLTTKARLEGSVGSDAGEDALYKPSEPQAACLDLLSTEPSRYQLRLRPRRSHRVR